MSKNSVINVSKDQNTIVHKNGITTIFSPAGIFCSGCFYEHENKCFKSIKGLCSGNVRKDKKTGIFIQKQ